MPSILDKLNKKLSPLTESEDMGSWKDPHSGAYDRQRAEDALYHTIGPLTDSPTWDTKDWSSKSEPVDGFRPGAPAPQWTPEELVFAFAGDPSLLFKASGNPKSPGYGDMGGAPLYRLARRVANTYGRGTDKSFVADLYSNGFIPLTQMMQPGYDEKRGPFISYIMRTVQSAMEHGTGGSTTGDMAQGHQSQFFTDPDGNMRKRKPGDAGEEGWTEHSAIGIKGLLKLTDPQAVRQAAQVVQGKYQTEKHHDKHPGNPFGGFSPQYFGLANQYADALEAGNPEAVEASQNQLRQLLTDVEDMNASIGGASTGLGQAVSTPNRGKCALCKGQGAIKDPRDPEGGLIKCEKCGGDGVDGVGVQSMDVPADDGKTMAGNVLGGDDGEDGTVDPESIEYILDLAINHDLSKILATSEKYNELATMSGAKVDKKTGRAKLGGPMTANEMRYLIRSLGPLGSNYPGRGRARANTKIPRDGKKWWQPGEDPEIEPLAEGGMWHSLWSRNNYPTMGPTEIAAEMTKEVLEFEKVGVASARAAKVAQSGTAVSKVAISNTTKAGRIKLMIIADIHRDQIGVRAEGKKSYQIPLMEDLDPIDCHMIATVCESMIRRIDRSLHSNKIVASWKPRTGGNVTKLMTVNSLEIK